mmetsp:Transcript_27088/g.84221  ORF Transcript_27088/g.84221 Transcript_27088/m.84221 type:complete len:627 (-) Transcript_27088:31-1911(-)
MGQRRPQVPDLRRDLPLLPSHGRGRAPPPRAGLGHAPPLRRQPRLRRAEQVGRVRGAAPHPPEKPSREPARARARLGRPRRAVAARVRRRGPADAVAPAGPRRPGGRVVDRRPVPRALLVRRARLLRVPRLAPRRLGLPALARPPPRVRRHRGHLRHVAPDPRVHRVPRQLQPGLPGPGVVRQILAAPDPAVLRVVRRDELRGPLQFRVLPAVDAARAAQVLRLHVVLPQPAPHEIPLELLPLLPLPGLPLRHRAPDVGRAPPAGLGPDAARAQDGGHLPRARPRRPEPRDARAVLLARALLADARDGAAGHALLADLLRLGAHRHADFARDGDAALPLPRHRGGDVVPARRRALLPRQGQAAGHREARRGRRGRGGGRRRQVRGPRGVEQGRVAQRRRRDHARARRGEATKRKNRPRQRPHDGGGARDDQAQDAARGRRLRHGRDRQNRAVPLRRARAPGPPRAVPHDGRGPLRGPRARGGRGGRDAGARLDARGGGGAGRGRLGPGQNVLRAHDPRARAAGRAGRGLRGAAPGPAARRAVPLRQRRRAGLRSQGFRPDVLPRRPRHRARVPRGGHLPRARRLRRARDGPRRRRHAGRVVETRAEARLPAQRRGRRLGSERGART